MQGLADIQRAPSRVRIVGVPSVWRSCVCVSALAVLSFATSASAAPSKKRPAKQIVALVPTTADGNVAKPQLDSIDRALANSAGQHADVVAVRALDKRVGRGSFPAAVKACKGDGSCLAKLARATKVEVIVAPTAKADSDGVTVTTTVAGANDTIHRVSFTFATAADLNTGIGKNAAELFSSGQPTEEPALESLAALPLEPLEASPTAATPTPPVTPPTSEPPVIAKAEPPAATPDVKDEPRRGKNGKSHVADVTETPPILDVPPPAELPLAPLSTRQTVPPPTREHRIGWGTYVGSGAAALGVAGITFGIIEYIQHKNIVDSANANTTLTQRQAQAQDEAAKTKYDNSRIGLYAGVPLLIAGAALIAWDIAIADHGTSATAESDNHLKLTVLPSPNGAFGSAVLTW